MTTRMLENKVSRETDQPLLSPASNVIAERSRVADAHRRNSRLQWRSGDPRSRGRARTGESPQFRSRSHRDRLEHPAAAPELQTHPHCMWISQMGRQSYTVDRWTSAPVQLSRSHRRPSLMSPNRVRGDFDGHPLEDRQRRECRLIVGFAVRALRIALEFPPRLQQFERFSRPSQRSIRDCPR